VGRGGAGAACRIYSTQEQRARFTLLEGEGRRNIERSEM